MQNKDDKCNEAIRELEKKLAISGNLLTSLLDSVDDIVFAVEFGTHKLLFSNGRLHDDMIDPIVNSKTCWEIFCPNVGKPCEFCLHKQLVDENGNPTGKQVKHEVFNPHMNRWYDITATLIDWHGGIKAVVMAYHDVTDAKNESRNFKNTVASLELERSMHEFALESSSSFSWEGEMSHDVLRLSKAVELVIGYPSDYFDDTMSKYSSIIKPEYRAEVDKIRRDCIDGVTELYNAEFPITTATGETKWLLGRGKFADEKRDLIYGVTMDISERKRYEQRLAELAYKDSLTELFNMHYLVDGLIRTKSKEFTDFGGMLIDIRGFKNVNDAFGFEYGDRLLKDISIKLKELAGNNPIVRVTGDRFLIVYENCTEKDLVSNAEGVLQAFKMFTFKDGQIVGVNFKIGIAICCAADAMTLLKDTEIALHYAKADNVNDYCVLNAVIKSAFQNRVNVELELRKAIDNKEFEMYYQAKIDTKTKRLAGAEALIRWRHPEHGMIQPIDFIPIAEETGLIIPIGEFVLDEAAKHLNNWLEKGLDMFVSLNLSPQQFLSSELTQRIIDAVERYKLPAKSLVVEIIERTMISDFGFVRNLLNELRAHGIGVSLDDFGTGYSSLSYLDEMPIDYIKIDKSFIDNAVVKKSGKAILETLITMSHKLNFQVTAEGVETEEQFNMLDEFDCDYIQGFLYSRPMPFDEFNDFMDKYSAN